MTFHNAHLSAHGFIGAGTHNAILPPAPAVVIIPHVSASTLLGTTIKAKFSKQEFGPGMFPLMGRGSDSGFIVPHVSIPPTNVLLVVIIPLGSSKIMFGSSKVQINVDGKAEHCGCCVPPVIPLSLNMACNDLCSYPSDLVVAPNTIEVSMTLGDILMGVLSAAFDVAVSYFVGMGAGKIGGAALNRLARMRLGSAVFWELAGDLGPQLGREVFNTMAENMTKSAGGEILSGFINEGVKTVMGNAIDSTVNAVSSGDVTNMGDLLDKSGEGWASVAGQSPASDSRIYSTNGPGVRTSEW